MSVVQMISYAQNDESEVLKLVNTMIHLTRLDQCWCWEGQTRPALQCWNSYALLFGKGQGATLLLPLQGQSRVLLVLEMLAFLLEVTRPGAGRRG